MSLIFSVRSALMAVGLCLLAKESMSLKSMKIKVPEAIKSGDTVTLTCDYDLENDVLYSIKWYWNDEEFYRYIPKESPPFNSFPVKYVNVDVSKSGEKSVTLRKVRRELAGDYKCEVSADAPLFHTNILVSHMSVAELPTSKPSLNIRDTKVEVGKRLDVECTQRGSYPAANITWYINNVQVEDNSDFITIYPTNIELDNALDLKSAKSKISILTNKTHFVLGGMTIRCEASIFDLWRGTTEEFIRDETPQIAHVVESSLSQSQLDPKYETGSSARWTSSISNATIFFCLLSSILKVVVFR